MAGHGIPIQSGTVLVERAWSQFLSMPPLGARRVSARWWKMLSHLLLLKYNFRFFATDDLPDFVATDVHVACMLEFLHLLSGLDEREASMPNLQTLLEPFSPAP